MESRSPGRYRYQGGWNLSALIAAAIGALFSSILPNFTTVLPGWWAIYGWFFGVAIGAVAYLLLSMLMRRPAAAAATA
jgi:NCS1 family nucleobase:cation symporter-1